MVLSPGIRLWLLPSVVLLVVLGAWGAIRYPSLPDRIPRHVGSGGVDAWADRSIGSAFLLVFLYAGVTVLMTATTELVLRITPKSELEPTGSPFARSASELLLNRPATRASARRIARALLTLNACVGLSFLASCGVQWRGTPDPDVPGWLFAAVIAPIAAGTVLVLAVALYDRAKSGPRTP